MTFERKTALRPPSPEEKTLLIAIVSLLIGLTLSCKAEQILDLLPASVVSTPHVLLRDIISKPESLPSAWAEREVVASPEPGRSTAISISSIAYALQKYRDMEQIILRGGMQITIERSRKDISEETICRALQNFVRDSSDFDPADSFEISVDPGVEFPADASEETMSVTGRIPLDEPFRHEFSIAFNNDHEKPDIVTVNATVRPLRKIFVARNAIRRGSVLTKHDLEIQKMSPDNSGDYLAQGDVFAGMELSRSLRAGEPVNKNCLLDIVCAEKGEIINVCVENKSLSVSMQARALAPGRRGDRIVCMNENSKKRITARLTAPKEARLDI